jgi:hypothetical protein
MPGFYFTFAAALVDSLEPVRNVVLRSGSGVAGVADARILAAYQAMAGANPPTPITPAKLASRAVTGYPTALRWLKIHHPELLVSKPDEASVAPVAVAPAPPVVAPEPKPAPLKPYRNSRTQLQRSGPPLATAKKPAAKTAS